MTHQSTWTFFLTHKFAFSTTQIGVVLATSALAGAVYQARAVGPVVRRLGDKRAAVAGSLLGCVSLTATAFVSVPWLLYLLCAVGVLGSLAGTAAQSWISRAVRADEQGTVQGALAGIGAVAETVVPITAGVAFGWSLTYASPGSVYLGAAVFAAGSALLLAVTPDVRSTSPEQTLDRA
nr:MFS transporter [Micromonospora andamanensis]